jgi:hypothetical protein
VVQTTSENFGGSHLSQPEGDQVAPSLFGSTTTEYRNVAQLVEQRSPKPQAAGSNPVIPANPPLTGDGHAEAEAS